MAPPQRNNTRQPWVAAVLYVVALPVVAGVAVAGTDGFIVGLVAFAAFIILGVWMVQGSRDDDRAGVSR